MRRTLEALNAGDLDAVFECFHESCVFDGSRMAEGVYEGKDAFRGFLEGVLESVAPQHREVELREAEGRVIATGRIEGTGRLSGAGVAMPVAYVYDFRDGLIARQTIYPEPGEAWAAIGQEPQR